jgi:hypothetical protein
MTERERMTAAGITGEDQDVLIRSLDHIRGAGVKIEMEDVIKAARDLENPSGLEKAMRVISNARRMGRSD